jgi:hypothetical protein
VLYTEHRTSLRFADTADYIRRLEHTSQVIRHIRDVVDSTRDTGPPGSLSVNSDAAFHSIAAIVSRDLDPTLLFDLEDDLPKHSEFRDEDGHLVENRAPAVILSEDCSLYM